MSFNKKILGFVIFGIFGFVFLILSIISYKESKIGLNDLHRLESKVSRIALETATEPRGRSLDLVCLQLADWNNAFGIKYGCPQLEEKVSAGDSITIYFIPNDHITVEQHNFDVFQIEKNESIVYGIDEKRTELMIKFWVEFVYSILMFILFFWGINYSK